MKFSEIKALALKQSPVEIRKKAELIALQLMNSHLSAYEITLTSMAEVEQIESILYSMEIPCYAISEDTLSVGKTYYDLYIFESGR